MGSLGNSWENYVLDHVLKNSALTVPDDLFIALLTGDPGEDASGMSNELSGGAYVRQTCATWDAAVARATENTNEILFVQATANLGTVTHYAILSTLTNTGVNYMIAYGEFTTSKRIQSGDQGRILVGEMDISFATITTSGFSTDLANKLLDHIFGVSSYSQPTNIYVGLSLASPGNDMQGLDEPSVGNYSRILNNDWDGGVSGIADNTNAITFNEATANLGTVTHLTIWDHASIATQNNFLFWGPTGTEKQITSGETARISAGDADVILT